MAKLDILNQKHPVTIGLVAVFVIGAIAAAAFGGVSMNMTGMAAYNPQDTTFPVVISGPHQHDGWGECSGEVTWTMADQLCKDFGKAGAAPVGERACLHSWAPTRYYWDGTTQAVTDADGKTDIVMNKGTAVTAGYAFTKVKCV